MKGTLNENTHQSAIEIVRFIKLNYSLLENVYCLIITPLGNLLLNCKLKDRSCIKLQSFTYLISIKQSHNKTIIIIFMIDISHLYVSNNEPIEYY